MSTYIVVIIACIIVVAIVLILSLVTISKGYAYKHEIDPLPDEWETTEGKHEEDSTDKRGE
ncbi:MULTISPECIES: YtzI protein [Virgibacillus]|uniref:Tumour necrosis factor receptor superfamily member 19 n=2 Tax=Virgibacillus TaxID=84406 RepID=A0A024QFP1_9BACI|nr:MULTISPECIES: YtzI protein [Virgibacillus]EQB38869.1 hypothetical protein M948_00570 [Virgibacillus sp. CM-4]GGJ66660.1 hypothetical protein GCM10007111_30860 [Virgibacillus kapii]CDQ40995.1 Tumour necrosis factor receptor superfamily member 19 [Virgibacillus massiliensis]